MNKERKQKEQHKEDRLVRTRQRIRGACSQLHRSVLSPLLANVTLLECAESDSDVLIGGVSPSSNALWVNPYRRQEFGEAEWTFILAHLLLHLGLGHHTAPPDKHALLWTLACEHAADNLAHGLHLGRAPHDYGVDTTFVGMTETAIYALLAEDKRALANVKTYAGNGRPDIIRREARAASSALGQLYQRGGDRRDYELLLAAGIRMGVERAVDEAAEALGQAEADRSKTWRPLENAKRWVMNELPLLGALAAQLRTIADGALCDRMDISVAAVNAHLGEIYFHTGRGLSQDEVLFVYVHELLHVALLHHARLQGRDPYLWNLACFPAGTWTGFGKPIETIATMQRHYTGELIEISTQTGKVCSTPEHPFFVRQRRGKSYPIQVSEPVWIEAKDLQTGDYLLVPRFAETDALTWIDLSPYIQKGTDSKGRDTFGNRALHRIPLDEEVAWAIGLYVAEGSSSPYPRWSLAVHEETLVQRLHNVAKHIGCSSCVTDKRGWSVSVVFGSVVFGRWLKEQCGANAHSKCIPQVILRHSNPAIRHAFLQGLVDGDGHVRRQTASNQQVIILGSVSEQLILDVTLLLAQDGIGVSRRVMTRGPRQIGTTWTDSTLTLYLLSWNPQGVAISERTLNGHTITSHSHRWRADEHGVWYPIKSVSAHPFDGPVYNLTTKEHTYIAQGFLVHNCDFVINGWLIEMGVGQFPHIGGLYDPRLKGMSAEEVYDLLGRDPRKCKNLVGFGGKKGDVLLDERRLYKGEATTLDDLYRRCMASGMACQGYGRGTMPAGLIEEIRSLFTPPVPWDVELARWMDAHVPMVRESLRSYGRPSRRQASTPDIPRPARYVPQEWKDACTFGVILDTSGSMDREMLGRALGAIASYAEARDVPAARLVLCDAAPYDRGFVCPTDLRGIFPVQGRGGTVLQPAINYLLNRPDFPASAPLMIITDGWCEEELLVPRDHCFVMPRKGWKEGATPLRTSAPVFRVLKLEQEND